MEIFNLFVLLFVAPFVAFVGLVIVDDLLHNRELLTDLLTPYGQFDTVVDAHVGLDHYLGKVGQASQGDKKTYRYFRTDASYDQEGPTSGLNDDQGRHEAIKIFGRRLEDTVCAICGAAFLDNGIYNLKESKSHGNNPGLCS